MSAVSAHEVEVFYRGYLECALWSSTAQDAEGNGVEGLLSYDPSDDCAGAMLADCADFCATHADALRLACAFPGYDLSSAGHDFWLTRNHHGAGFWDRGMGSLGQSLTGAAHAYGGVDLYLSDAGEVEQQ